MGGAGFDSSGLGMPEDLGDPRHRAAPVSACAQVGALRGRHSRWCSGWWSRLCGGWYALRERDSRVACRAIARL